MFPDDRSVVSESINSREKVLAKAREDRALREQTRNQNRNAIKIQAHIRGFLEARRMTTAFQVDLQNKLSDIAKVQFVVKQQTGRDFELPLITLVSLCRQAVFVEMKAPGVVSLQFLHFALNILTQQPNTLHAFVTNETRMTHKLIKMSIHYHCTNENGSLASRLFSAYLDTTNAREASAQSFIKSISEHILNACENIKNLPEDGSIFSQSSIDDDTTLIQLLMSSLESITNRTVRLEMAKRLFAIPVLVPYRLTRSGMESFEFFVGRHVALVQDLFWHGEDPSIVWTFGNFLMMLNVMTHRAIRIPLLSKLSTLIHSIPMQTYSGSGTVLRLTKSICMAMPELLAKQIHLLMDPVFCRNLYIETISLSQEALANDLAFADQKWVNIRNEMENVESVTPTLAHPRPKSFFGKLKDAWLGSAWSKRLSQNHSTTSPLTNQTEASRYLAGMKTDSMNAERSNFHDDAVYYSIEILSTFVSKWKPSIQNTLAMSFMSAWAFCNRSISHELWILFQRDDALWRNVKTLCQLPKRTRDTLIVLCNVMTHILQISDDAEIHELHYPLHLWGLLQLVLELKTRLFASITQPDFESNSSEVVRSALVLMNTLYDRHSRRPLFPDKYWVIDTFNQKNAMETFSSQVSNEQKHRFLKFMPYAVPFAERARMFRDVVSTDRVMHQPKGINTKLVVRRIQLFEDGFVQVRKTPNLKAKLYVNFINEAGHLESGIDAGGLFKEFWTELSKIAFDPNYGFLISTEDNLLYANPFAQMIYDGECISKFEFLGSILGKALYEDILVQPQFARFFLAKFLHKPCVFEDLPSLDHELYKNLCFLKTYDGDIADLGLTFSITVNEFGATREVELLPGGRNIDVTSSNKFRYVNMVAQYHLSHKGNAETEAFLRGFHRLIHPDWIEGFTPAELQVLISGKQEDISVSELRKYTIYRSQLQDLDPTIRRFWSVLDSFSAADKSLFLKFVTSCERPPLLGFSALTPPFCIDKISISNDNELLPTASTCFNILRLPTYSSSKVMKEKLLYVIHHGTGFELS